MGTRSDNDDDDDDDGEKQHPNDDDDVKKEVEEEDLLPHERDASLPVVVVEEDERQHQQHERREDESNNSENDDVGNNDTTNSNGDDEEEAVDNSSNTRNNSGGEEEQKEQEEESEGTKRARAKLLNDPLLEVFAKISPEVAANLTVSSIINDDDDDDDNNKNVFDKIPSSVIDQIFKAAFVGSNSGDAVLSGQTYSGKNYLEKSDDDEKKILYRLLPKLLSEEIAFAKKQLNEDEALANLIFPKKPEIVDGIRDAGGLRSDEISDAEARVMIERRFANAYASSQSDTLANDVDATADAEAKMKQLDTENLLENEKAPGSERRVRTTKHQERRR